MLGNNVLKLLLKIMRGKRSQAQVSRRLGSSDIQVYRWESGRVTMKWEDFINYGNACGFDMDAVVNEGVFFNPRNKPVKELVRYLIGATNTKTSPI